MSRRITTKATVLSAGTGSDDYLGRVVKYIPAEIVALYVAATGIVPVASESRLTVLWVIFWFCAIATPLYMAFATSNRKKKQTPLWVQVVLATIAFPVWAYALGGVFSTTPYYESYIASLLLMGATFIFGLIQP